MRSVATMVALSLATASAWAQPRPQVQPVSASAQLGRLFHTPQQRQEMDRRRELNIQEVVIVNEGTVTLNGQVTRSSGKTTTWVNGAPQHDTHRPRDSSTVAVSPSQGAARVPLKVGQSLDRARGTITDNLEGGSVSVDRTARGAR